MDGVDNPSLDIKEESFIEYNYQSTVLDTNGKCPPVDQSTGEPQGDYSYPDDNGIYIVRQDIDGSATEFTYQDTQESHERSDNKQKEDTSFKNGSLNDGVVLADSDEEDYVETPEERVPVTMDG